MLDFIEYNAQAAVETTEPADHPDGVARVKRLKLLQSSAACSQQENRVALARKFERACKERFGAAGRGVFLDAGEPAANADLIHGGLSAPGVRQVKVRRRSWRGPLREVLEFPLEFVGQRGEGVLNADMQLRGANALGQC